MAKSMEKIDEILFSVTQWLPSLIFGWIAMLITELLRATPNSLAPFIRPFISFANVQIASSLSIAFFCALGLFRYAFWRASVVNIAQLSESSTEDGLRVPGVILHEVFISFWYCLWLLSITVFLAFTIGVLFDLTAFTTILGPAYLLFACAISYVHIAKWNLKHNMKDIENYRSGQTTRQVRRQRRKKWK